MTRLTREAVVAEALELLDEVGLDQVSTHTLARRLGIKQPSLYSHFRNKDELLAAMAEAAMAPHARFPLPSPSDDWREWFMANTDSFRQTLLLRRDGARLHAGSRPVGAGLERTRLKIDFLVGAGLPQHPAEMAMLAASRFTVGSVLEQQAEQQALLTGAQPHGTQIDHDEAFRCGVSLIIDGLGLVATECD
ncbi:MAG: TetR/AcrR family transcriptional regulator C-terminal domain-containing protein [Propionibacteriaceae bacterium]|nr:TetR/AcrR family transcriptional regulator C-terminal domain-containing protein [Propionibacteriaceae bacterium]